MHNLPWTTTWQQLKDAFKEWKVERADVVYDSWGKSRCGRVWDEHLLVKHSVRQLVKRSV